ncbi:hypothetical protein BDL97_12G054300 [Sphagnum fallax]|uniref:Uncharacterized protein n=2 Tax=Sphagnum jensenii TaxID=128206 RepID=A0ABP1BJK7_9BRYO|nr:hypothetical protein BDL97_12G054300 [Sphagnum fallax]
MASPSQCFHPRPAFLTNCNSPPFDQSPKIQKQSMTLDSYSEQFQILKTNYCASMFTNVVDGILRDAKVTSPKLSNYLLN